MVSITSGAETGGASSTWNKSAGSPGGECSPKSTAAAEAATAGLGKGDAVAMLTLASEPTDMASAGTVAVGARTAAAAAGGVDKGAASGATLLAA
ncbi:MAG: hypothetical protein N2439_16780, partial [Anaerolineae bacterium]|nr:hypothetical protein [Anaerolineae bacterium]